MTNTYRRRDAVGTDPNGNNETELLMRLGTETGTGAVHITRADAHAEIRRMRRDIAILERMARSEIVYRLDKKA